MTQHGDAHKLLFHKGGSFVIRKAFVSSILRKIKILYYMYLFFLNALGKEVS